ncbi:MAG: hypothetical protein RJA09_167, partial [Pseudomonadota bacterium]
LNSLPHLAGELVNKMGQMGLVTVPYPAPPAAVSALLAGDATLVTDGVPGLLPHVKGGRLRALAVTSAQRLPGLDIPTVAETYPGYEVIGWFQVMAPTGTPAAVVERVNQDVNRILQQTDLVTRLNEMGIYPRNDNLAAAKTFFADQQRTMKKLVADLGVQPQ